MFESGIGLVTDIQKMKDRAKELREKFKDTGFVAKLDKFPVETPEDLVSLMFALGKRIPFFITKSEEGKLFMYASFSPNNPGHGQIKDNFQHELLPENVIATSALEQTPYPCSDPDNPDLITPNPHLLVKAYGSHILIPLSLGTHIPDYKGFGTGEEIEEFFSSVEGVKLIKP